MADLKWNGDDFRNSKDSSGATADLVSHKGKLQQGYRHGSLTRGMVAYYPMDKGEGRVLHDGALDNLGQIKGASWNGSGQVGNDALSFDGTDDYVAVDTPGIDSDSSFTFHAWVKPSDLSNVGVVYDERDTGFVGHFLTAKSTGFEFNVNGPDNGVIATTQSISTGNWYSLAGVWDEESSTATVYLNGAEGGSDTNNSIRDTDVSDVLAYGTQSGGVSGDVNPKFYFDGFIGEFRFYDRKLSAKEIEALYNLNSPSGRKVTESDVPSNSDGGVSRYTFDGNVNDSWGANDGTDNTSAGYVKGVYGQAKDFDGTDDRVELPNLGLSKTQSFTISHWLNTSNISSDWASISRWDGSDDVLQFYHSESFNQMFVEAGHTSGTRLQAIIPNSNLDSGDWQQLTMVFNATTQTIRAYKNGSLIDSDSGTVDDFATNDGLWVGARSDAAGYFNGAIDDVRIYNKALAPVQVERLFNLGAWRINRGDTLQ